MFGVGGHKMPSLASSPMYVVDYVVNPVRLSHATASVRRARMHFNMQESLTA